MCGKRVDQSAGGETPGVDLLLVLRLDQGRALVKKLLIGQSRVSGSVKFQTFATIGRSRSGSFSENRNTDYLRKRTVPRLRPVRAMSLPSPAT